MDSRLKAVRTNKPNGSGSFSFVRGQFGVPKGVSDGRLHVRFKSTHNGHQCVFVQVSCETVQLFLHVSNFECVRTHFELTTDQIACWSH